MKVKKSERDEDESRDSRWYKDTDTWTSCSISFISQHPSARRGDPLPANSNLPPSKRLSSCFLPVCFIINGTKQGCFFSSFLFLFFHFFPFLLFNVPRESLASDFCSATPQTRVALRRHTRAAHTCTHAIINTEDLIKSSCSPESYDESSGPEITARRSRVSFHVWNMARPCWKVIWMWSDQSASFWGERWESEEGTETRCDRGKLPSNTAKEDQEKDEAIVSL